MKLIQEEYEPKEIEKIMLKATGKTDGKQCTNLELLKVRDELALHLAMAVVN